MMKGFKIDTKGQKRRMKYQEMQRLGLSKHSFLMTQTKGQLKSFVGKRVSNEAY